MEAELQVARYPYRPSARPVRDLAYFEMNYREIWLVNEDVPWYSASIRFRMYMGRRNPHIMSWHGKGGTESCFHPEL